MYSLFGVFSIPIYIFIGWYICSKNIDKIKKQYAGTTNYKGIVKSIENGFLRNMYDIEFQYEEQLLKRKAVEIKKLGHVYKVGDEVEVYYDKASLTECSFTDFSDDNK